MSGNYDIEECSFFSHTWDYEMEETSDYGNKIIRFKKELQEHTFSLHITTVGRVSCEEAYAQLLEILETDILENKPGKLYVGNYYLECYILENKPKHAVPGIGNLTVELKLAAPYPFWINPKTYSFLMDTQEIAEVEYDYPYSYPYGYMNGQRESILEQDHYCHSHFIMIIYGPCVNPQIVIGKNVYEIYTELQEKEYLTINSREGTIIKTDKNGNLENEFYKRNFETDIFAKIPYGKNHISWDNSFGFDITVLRERSEPKWV